MNILLVNWGSNPFPCTHYPDKGLNIEGLLIILQGGMKIMKKGIYCLFVCMLLITTFLPITAIAGDEKNPEIQDTSVDAILQFRFNQRGLTITNIGNVTAQDVWWNVSNEGRLLLVGNRNINGTLAQLEPGSSMTATLGFMLGFGKMTFHIQAGAANVEPLDKNMTGTLVLLFILWFLN